MKRNSPRGGRREKKRIEECLLVIQALDGADVGADDGDLGCGVHGALPQQRLARAPAVVVAEQGLGGAVLRPPRRPAPGPGAVHALDVVVVAPLPLRAAGRPRGAAVHRAASSALGMLLFLLPCRPGLRLRNVQAEPKGKSRL
jgi:hypothetical protein